MQMQHDGLDSHPYSRPELIFGGIKYAMNEPKVRIDYVHHALSAMYQYLVAARTDPNLPANVKLGYTDDQRQVMRLANNPSLRAPGTPGPLPVAAATGMDLPLTIDSLRARAMQVPTILPAGGNDKDGE